MKLRYYPNKNLKSQKKTILRYFSLLQSIVPKLLKDQIKMNVNIHKGSYNLRNKFKVS